MIPRKKTKKEVVMESFGEFSGFGIGLFIFVSMFYLILTLTKGAPFGLGYFHVLGIAVSGYLLYGIAKGFS